MPNRPHTCTISTMAKRIAAALAMIACPLIVSANEGKMLDKIYANAWRGAKSVPYIAPPANELKTMQQLFVRLLKGEPVSKIARELQALGWTVSTHKQGSVTWTIVAEADDQRRGRGLYAFSSKGRHALQAPHVPSDKFTGQLLLRYAEDAAQADEESPRALAWNTVPRTTADLADLDGSYLIAFSRAFAQTYPSEKILQLHGFDFKRRRSMAGAMSSAIVSPSHRHPSSSLKSAVNCMQQHLEKHTHLYGVDVRELGGTENSVARALRSDGYAGFIHVEMDLPMRQSLVNDQSKRQTMLACLGGGK